jgi:cell division protein FtsB
MQKLLALILLVLIIWLQYRILYGENGLSKLESLTVKIEEQREQNAQLEKQNILLRKEVHLLRNNPHVLEEKAREHLGLVKKDEVFYRIIPLDSN